LQLSHADAFELLLSLQCFGNPGCNMLRGDGIEGTSAYSGSEGNDGLPVELSLEAEKGETGMHRMTDDLACVHPAWKPCLCRLEGP